MVPRTRSWSYYLTQRKLHRVSISNGSDLLEWLRRKYSALKYKFVEGRGYETYSTKKVKKSRKKTQKRKKTTMEEKEEASIPLITLVKNILHSFFSNVEVYINNLQNYTSNGLYAHKSYISNNFKGAISEYKGGSHSEGNDCGKVFDEIVKALVSEYFFQGARKCIVDPMVLCCMVNWVMTFSSLLNCYIQTWNLGYD